MSSTEEGSSASTAAAAIAGSASAGEGTGGGGGFRKKPVVLLFMGMAGSGKTTLVQRLNLYLNEKVRGWVPVPVCLIALTRLPNHPTTTSAGQQVVLREPGPRGEGRALRGQHRHPRHRGLQGGTVYIILFYFVLFYFMRVCCWIDLGWMD
jgi:hypothetical protein